MSTQGPISAYERVLQQQREADRAEGRAVCRNTAVGRRIKEVFLGLFKYQLPRAVKMNAVHTWRERVVGTTTAQAQQPPPPTDSMMIDKLTEHTLEADGLSGAEAKRRSDQITSLFWSFDVNSDGNISFAEFHDLATIFQGGEFHKEEAERTYIRMDRNADGGVDESEFMEFIFKKTKALNPTAFDRLLAHMMSVSHPHLHPDHPVNPANPTNLMREEVTGLKARVADLEAQLASLCVSHVAALRAKDGEIQKLRVALERAVRQVKGESVETLTSHPPERTPATQTEEPLAPTPDKAKVAVEQAKMETTSGSKQSARRQQAHGANRNGAVATSHARYLLTTTSLAPRMIGLAEGRRQGDSGSASDAVMYRYQMSLAWPIAGARPPGLYPACSIAGVAYHSKDWTPASGSNGSPAGASHTSPKPQWQGLRWGPACTREHPTPGPRPPKVPQEVRLKHLAPGEAEHFEIHTAYRTQAIGHEHTEV